MLLFSETFLFPFQMCRPASVMGMPSAQDLDSVFLKVLCHPQMTLEVAVAAPASIVNCLCRPCAAGTACLMVGLYAKAFLSSGFHCCVDIIVYL